MKESIQTEFVAGVLVCNNVVAVRRVSLIEGGHPGRVCNNVVAVRRVSLIEGGHPGRVCAWSSHM